VLAEERCRREVEPTLTMRRSALQETRANDHELLPTITIALLPVPLACTLAFFGLAYGIFPDIVIGRMTLWEAAISTASLNIVLVDVAITLPVIVADTVFTYRVFRGKARALTYG
jgi:cytochrome bd-type quinol oxidase subunit 2